MKVNFKKFHALMKLIYIDTPQYGSFLINDIVILQL